jgi:hypothetical protein
MKLLRSRVTYANLVATLALVFAVGGGAVATGALKSEDRIVGCLSEAGRITVVPPKTACAAGETRIAWNKTGPAGKRGLRGFDGKKGDDGRRGPVGATGPAGAAGANGKVGVAGPAGAGGSDGLDGKTGATGPRGAQGDKGETGGTGSQGEKGDACLSSDAACVGEKGERGEIGETGGKGDQGEIGETGPRGPQGVQGETGARGAQGDQGEAGETGATGAKGDRGDACLPTIAECVGPKGEPGTSGAATPAGAVMSFNLQQCPDGWSEFAAAQGRSIVGLPAGGELGGTAGTALANLENRAVGQHTHDVTDPGHTHVVPPHVHTTPAYEYWQGEYAHYSSYWNGSYEVYNSPYSWPQPGSYLEAYIRYWKYTQAAQSTPASEAYDSGNAATGVTLDPSGGVAGTNAPYVQLLSCQKD